MAYITGRVEHPAKKFLKYLLVVIVLVSVVASFFYLNPQLWREWVKGTPLEPPPTVTKTYKWRDADGNWQVSDRPPKGDVEYETIIYSNDVNVVPSIRTSEEEN